MPTGSTTNGNGREVSAETDEPSPMLETPTIRFRRRDSFLFDTRLSLGKYILLMAALSLVPSLLLGLFFSAVGILTEDTAPPLETGSFTTFLAVVFVAPPVETAAMAFTLWVMSLVTQRFAVRAAINSILWGALHSATAPAWGLIVWWPFFIFSCAYLAWRGKSRRHGYLAATSIHMIQNLCGGIFLLFGA